MASIKRIEGPRGPRWQVRYRDPQNRQKAQNFDRAGDARAFAAQVEHTVRAGSYLAPAAGRITFAEMAGRWREVARHADTTAAVCETDLRRHVLPVIGRMHLDRITPLDLERLQRHLEGRLAPATVGRVWWWVSAVFAAAVRDRRLTSSPAAGMAPPRAARPELVILEGAAVEAVMAEMPGHYRAAVLLAADAGLRNGEVFGLTVSRVGFLARQRHIRVERQLITAVGAPNYLRLPKRGKTRVVPVGASVTDMLAVHLAGTGRASAFDRVSGRPAEDLVFATTGGVPVIRQLIDQSFARAARRAGLPTGVRFHDLRHYYASVLIDAGLSEREIGERLGHSSGEVTARYGTLFDRAADRTRQAVEAEVARRRGAR